MRRDHRRRDQRGAAAVEAALIMPILCTLVFGMIEMGFWMKDYISVTSSVRAGARMASAAPNEGAARNDGTVPNADPALVPRFAQLTAEAVRTTGTALDSNQIEEIWIYRANAAGFPGTETEIAEGGCQPSTAACIRFTWSEARDDFRHAPGTEWRDVVNDVCATEGARVGVAMIASYKTVTGFLGDVTITDHSVMTFEPLTRDDNCP